MNEFKAATYQFQPKCGDKKYNLKKVIDALKNIEADLFVLPEFFSTGVCHKSFTEEPENPDGGETIEVLKDFARKTKTNIICGSVIEKDGKNLYNTTFVLDREGKTVSKYRKIHLFNMYGGSEDKRISRGKEIVIAPLDIGNAGLSICFDIRYPLHFNKLKDLGADFFVCPTAWGYSKDYENSMNWAKVWESFNVSRSNENNTPLISVNQFGQSSGDFYCIGSSMITDRDGNIISKAPDGEYISEAVITY